MSDEAPYQEGRGNNQTDNRDGGTSAQANNYGAPAALMWVNTVIATVGGFAGVVALVLVLTNLDDYHDQLALEKRLQTQAIDELRVEANVSRKLAGLPVIDSHEHGESK